jgi:biopolymer transport protein ExbB/TolQ
MPDLQTFIAILTALLVFLTGVFLNYDTIAFRNYQLIIPQWTGLLLAGITFSLVAVDQLLRGFVRLEEVQRRTEETQRRAEETQQRDAETQQRDEEIRRRNEETRRREEDSARATDERFTATERETRRTRIETRYRVAVIRFQLNPNALYRRQLADILALLEEYQETL